MKVSSYVILALWVTSSPAAAFTPHFSDTRSAKRTRIFAEEELAAEVGGTLAATDTTSSAPEAATEAAAGAGISASKAVPFLAPIAALAAGRQALVKRDIVKEQVAITEKDLQRIRKDLANVDTTISASFGVAAVTSAIALTNLVAVPFNGPNSASSMASTAPSTTASTVAALPQKAEKPTRKAPFMLRTTPVKPKIAPSTEKEIQEPPSYDALLQKLGKEDKSPSIKLPEAVAPVAKMPEVKASEVTKEEATEKSPSFMDTLMKKVEEKKEEKVEEKTEETAQKGPSFMDTLLQKIEDKKEEMKVEETKEAPPAVLEKKETTPSLIVQKEPPKVEAPGLETKKVEEPKPEAKDEVKTNEEAKVEAPKIAEEPKPELPKIEEKKTEEPKPETKPEANKAEESNAETPKADVGKVGGPKLEIKPVDIPTMERKKAEEPKALVKPVEATKIEQKIDKTETESRSDEKKAVASVAASIVSDGSTSLAVGAGVGIAALGVFAALVASQDQESDTTSSPYISETAPSKKPMGKTPKPSSGSYLDAISSDSKKQLSGRGSPSSTSYIEVLNGGKPATVKTSTIPKKPTRPGNPANYMDSLSMGNASPLSSRIKVQPPKPASVEAKTEVKQAIQQEEPVDGTDDGKKEQMETQVEAVNGAPDDKKPAPVVEPKAAAKFADTKPNGQMGPLVEEKKQPPRPAGPVSYVDAMSSMSSTQARIARWTPSKKTDDSQNGGQAESPQTEDMRPSPGLSYMDALSQKQARKPEPWKPRQSGENGQSLRGSYLDSLAGVAAGSPSCSPGDSNEMLPSIDELDRERN